jgi:hypothetical protein
MPLLLRARVAWAHDWANLATLRSTRRSSCYPAPASPSTVRQRRVPRWPPGGELRLAPRWTFLTKFDGEFAPTAQTYAGSGTLRYRW